MNELVLDLVMLRDTGYPTSLSDRRWSVGWQRLWKGVPYYGQQTLVELDAKVGRLLMFGAAVSAPPPVNKEIVVSADSAIQIARSLLNARGFAPTEASRVELRIVLPKDFWITGRQNNIGRDGRLAWIVSTPATNARGIPNWTAVWVDVTNGTVIGGDAAGAKGPTQARLPGHSILATLSRARALQVKPSGASSAAAMVDMKKDPLRFYGALAMVRAPSHNEKPRPLKATHRLIAFLPEGKQAAFDYDARSRQIAGRDGDTVLAGNMLAVLIKTARPAPFDAKLLRGAVVTDR